MLKGLFSIVRHSMVLCVPPFWGGVFKVRDSILPRKGVHLVLVIPKERSPNAHPVYHALIAHPGQLHEGASLHNVRNHVLLRAVEEPFERNCKSQ
jgi:hypothetical protein